MNRIIVSAMAAAMAIGAPPAQAQGGGLSGLGGLLGGGLPDIGSVGASNAAGVLSYCLKNKLLSDGGAASIIGKLTGQPGVKSSDGFRLGQRGTIQSGDDRLPLASIKGRVKTMACDLLLKHAQNFL